MAKLKRKAPPLTPGPQAPATKTRFQKFEYREIPRGLVKGAPYNPRTISEYSRGLLKKKLEQVGCVEPLVWNERTGELVSGHQRLSILDELEGSREYSVAVAVVDLSDKDARHLCVFLNNAQAQGRFEKDAFVKMLEAGGDLSEMGLTPADIEKEFGGAVDLAGLLGKESDAEGGGVTEGLTDDDEVPDLQPDPITSPGDVWILGRHRVLCGDSTKREEVDRLMGGAKPDMVVTDPPYGIQIVKVKGESATGVVGGGKPYGKRGIVGGGGSAGAMYPYGGKKKGVGGGENIVKPTLYAPVANDDNPDTAEAFYRCAVESGIEQFIIFGGNYFTAFLAPSPCWIVWDKQNSGNFADVEMAWTSFDRGAKLYQFMWNGLCREGDRKTELKTRVHPTQKPVGLFVKIFADFEFVSCFDAFLGSGSTLIACEKTGRSCYGMELSRDYCDVIVKRWQNFTGEKATRESDGRTFEAIMSAAK